MYGDEIVERVDSAIQNLKSGKSCIDQLFPEWLIMFKPVINAILK